MHSWDESHSVIMCYYFHMSLEMVCLYFANEFCVCAHVGSSSGFGVRVTGLVREHSLSLYFLNEFVWFWCYFFPWISNRLQWWIHEDLWIQLECNCFTCFRCCFFFFFSGCFLFSQLILIFSHQVDFSIFVFKLTTKDRSEIYSPGVFRHDNHCALRLEDWSM